MKPAQCSGPREDHDCLGCLNNDRCQGYTQDELKLHAEKDRLYCMLLDSGLTHDQIRKDSNYYKD